MNNFFFCLYNFETTIHTPNISKNITHSFENHQKKKAIEKKTENMEGTKKKPQKRRKRNENMRRQYKLLQKNQKISKKRKKNNNRCNAFFSSFLLHLVFLNAPNFSFVLFKFITFLE